MIDHYIFWDLQLAFPLSLLALMVVASATAGPIEVIEISPDVGLHFDQEDFDMQRHLVKRSPIGFDPLSKKAIFKTKKTGFTALSYVPVLGAGGGAGGLAGAAAPFALEALGVSVFG